MGGRRVHNLFQSLRNAASVGAESATADAELVGRFAATRDEAAFEQLAWRHGGMVYGTAI